MRKKQLIAEFELTTSAFSALSKMGAELVAAQKQIQDLQKQLVSQGEIYEMRLRGVTFHTGEVLKVALPDELLTSLASKLSVSAAYSVQKHLDCIVEEAGAALMAVTQSQIARCRAILEKAEQVAKAREDAERAERREKEQADRDARLQEESAQLLKLGSVGGDVRFACYYKALEDYASMKQNPVLTSTAVAKFPLDHRLAHECYEMGMYVKSTYDVMQAKAKVM
jgi:DNA-binding phage protein